MKHLLRAFLVTQLIVFSLFSTGFASFLDKGCGISQAMFPRISGGHDEELMAKPWMVYLHISNKFICGGSLIHSTGHCFGDRYNNQRIIARLGEHNSQTRRDCDEDECAPPHREYLIINKIRHPSFQNSRLGETPDESESSVLQTAYMKNVDRFRCRYFYGYNVDHTHICAGSYNSYVGKGDSGSPLGAVIEHMNSLRFVQFGIVSHHRKPYYGVAVFTNVLAYTNWIHRVINAFK
ncbi:kallikrein-8-like [Drosophila serrata]|uniref:kallikrein-8-like n=1 Tax=Drosophila serrata TaxID=7274 RepID=UPI000A1D30DA|nr:kallikrein-8-like [Drosophila serrata]